MSPRENNNYNHPIGDPAGSWISKKITEEAVEWCKELGNKLSKGGLSTNQLRNFYGEVIKIQSDFEKNKENIVLLRAKLSYAEAKSKGVRGLKILNDKISMLITEVGQSRDNFTRFCKMMEAIVSFHKYYYENNKNNYGK